MAIDLIVALAVIALPALIALALRGRRLEGVRQWIGEFSFTQEVKAEIARTRTDIRKLSKAVGAMQGSISEMRLQMKALEAEINAGPAIEAFVRLRDRVERLEDGWTTARSVKRILDANERNIGDLRKQVELMDRKMEMLARE